MTDLTALTDRATPSPWAVDAEHGALVHRTTGHTIDLSAGFDTDALLRALHGVLGQWWADAHTVGTLVLHLDALVHVGHLLTYGRRAPAPLRRDVWRHRDRAWEQQATSERRA